MTTQETKILLKQKLKSAIYNKAGNLKSGYWPSQFIEMACHLGIIHSKINIREDQIQPVSLDLRLGEKAYRIRSSFLPEKETVEEKLKDLKLYEVSLSDGGILEKGAIYLVPLMEELSLPKGVLGVTNPKSSTGRLDMFTRVIIDKGHRFDEITSGYRGKMYLEIIPRSFPVLAKEGLCLNQLRLYQANPYLNDQNLKKEYKIKPILFGEKGNPISWEQVKVDDGLYISVDLKGKSKSSIIAYKAKSNSSVIDLTKKNFYKAGDFWEPIRRQRKNRLVLEPESFYIMVSKEKICIWPHLLGEMVAYEPNSGELRTHYAGFFDPGFGYHNGDNLVNQGTRAVMEVRPHDVPFLVEDGQTFCRLMFEKIIERPAKVYGQDIASHYHSQELKLSKYFKS